MAKKAHGPQVQSGNSLPSEVAQMNMIYNYVKPLYEKTVIYLMEELHKMLDANIQPNHEDGTMVVSELKMEDFLPLADTAAE